MITQFSSNIHRTNPWDWYMRYSMFSTAVLCHLCSGSSTAGENQASTSLKLHISVNHFRGLFRQLKTGAWKKKKQQQTCSQRAGGNYAKAEVKSSQGRGVEVAPALCRQIVQAPHYRKRNVLFHGSLIFIHFFIGGA